MLVTTTSNRLNQRWAWGLSAVVAGVALVLGFFFPWAFLGLLLAPVVYWLLRRRCWRRLAVMGRAFPDAWEAILRSRVVYYGALGDDGRKRFRQMVMVFLDETRITGVRTDVDDTTRVLVAASAIIPVFRFEDWEYSRLGEVLIYPASFDDSYRSDGAEPRGTLGMVGTGHLNGVMILSKPALLTGFDITSDKLNVGVHEFAHLVDGADGSIDGVPPGMPAETYREWITWVGKELGRPEGERSHIRPYGYTNEAEYYAVLTEYFFEAPEVLERKNPELYRLLAKMFRQDSLKLLGGAKGRRKRRLGRNSPCPCESGKKFKHCCLRRATRGAAA
ncbi:hypothetical protein Mal64_06040 [Pseudobythopirellula maris]|uniref:Protein MtfA n=1 Tax=Pseudobythopirellula maris TaxID=2527991 RepID=A0A5C5ZSI4_9BACT|nr:zinc-dependent peptidase [Pseudobythopirellula maris]TWT90220.1 hypothetical protein Mal64_06040 [Pseudobythopirellula maris]